MLIQQSAMDNKNGVSSIKVRRYFQEKREKSVCGKLFCGGCGYSMSYKPLREKINTEGLNLCIQH